MKTLYLVRHAKSDWGNEALPDIDRPLNVRGYRDAHSMGERLFSQGHVPQLIVSSPAIRALSTALIFARKFGYPAERVLLDDDIYEATTEALQTVIAGLPDECASVMLFGHNPVLTMAVNSMAGQSIPNVPTTGVTCIRFEARNWKQAAASTGELIFFDYPKAGQS